MQLKIDCNRTINPEVFTGNAVTSVILAVCELSIALISSCLPSIFTLVKHATAKISPRMSKKTAGFSRVGGVANFPMRTVRRPVSGTAEQDGFEQLEDNLIPAVHFSQGSMRPLAITDRNVLSPKEQEESIRPKVRIDRSVLAHKHASASF